MGRIESNVFILEGEILETEEYSDRSRARVICRPEWIILELDGTDFKLGDRIRFEGEFKVKQIQKLELEK